MNLDDHSALLSSALASLSVRQRAKAQAKLRELADVVEAIMAIKPKENPPKKRKPR